MLFRFLHNCVAHPLLFFTGDAKWAVRLHDWSSDRMRRKYPKNGGVLVSMNQNSPDSGTEPLMQFFAYAHLPAHLQLVSKPFCDLARAIVETVPWNPERTVALRKLLESKDCAVRAVIYEWPPHHA
jgi:hypothetical protein